MATFVALDSKATATTAANSSTDHGSTWSARTLPSAIWRAVAYGGGVFAAIGSSTTAATSPDGVTWTSRTMASGSWRDLAWNGSVFCAVGDGTACATSPDGVTWTAQTMPASANWVAIAWNGSVFCAIAGRNSSSTVAATSPDGVTWTSQTVPNEQWQDIAWNGTVFCAVNNTANVGSAATSPDGATWTSQTPTTTSLRAIAWNGTVFAAVQSGASAAETSSDGATWTTRTLPSSQTWISVSWDGTNFLALSSTATAAATSPDGTTWTAQTLAANGGWGASDFSPAAAALAGTISGAATLSGSLTALKPIAGNIAGAASLSGRLTSALEDWLATHTAAFRADLLTVTLRDGTIYRWTTSDVPLTYSGHTYGAHGTGAPLVRRGSFTRRLLPAVDTLDLTLLGQGGGALGSAGWTAGGKRLPQLGVEGYFDGARIRIDHAVMPTPGDFSLGVLPRHFLGRVAQVEPQGPNLRLRLKSEVETLTRLLPRFLIQPQCGNVVYDENCGLSAATFTISGTASGTPTTREVKSTTAGIIAKATGYFNLGVLTFTSGVNNGLSRAVATSTLATGTTTFALARAFPSAPSAGDTFTVYPGCDRSKAICSATFSNLAKWRGFPHVPQVQAGST